MESPPQNRRLWRSAPRWDIVRVAWRQPMWLFLFPMTGAGFPLLKPRVWIRGSDSAHVLGDDYQLKRTVQSMVNSRTPGAGQRAISLSRHRQVWGGLRDKTECCCPFHQTWLPFSPTPQFLSDTLSGETLDPKLCSSTLLPQLRIFRIKGGTEVLPVCAVFLHFFLIFRAKRSLT